uniref:zinc ribbon domain-containing protein n=1 Tax=Okeania sp. SIO2F4 TaxID=2607790 RepID=UPI0026015BBB|nr:zinc ribbon domain-containing protein [Okeania sp. SIO2F4]
MDRFFPSSKTCSRCGHVQDMPLSLRTYNCPECGISIDRDLNASINLRIGGRARPVNACG